MLQRADLHVARHAIAGVADGQLLAAADARCDRVAERVLAQRQRRHRLEIRVLTRNSDNTGRYTRAGWRARIVVDFEVGLAGQRRDGDALANRPVIGQQHRVGRHSGHIHHDVGQRDPARVVDRQVALGCAAAVEQERTIAIGVVAGELEQWRVHHGGRRGRIHLVGQPQRDVVLVLDGGGHDRPGGSDGLHRQRNGDGHGCVVLGGIGAHRVGMPGRADLVRMRHANADDPAEHTTPIHRPGLPSERRHRRDQPHLSLRHHHPGVVNHGEEHRRVTVGIDIDRER